MPVLQLDLSTKLYGGQFNQIYWLISIRKENCPPYLTKLYGGQFNQIYWLISIRKKNCPPYITLKLNDNQELKFYARNFTSCCNFCQPAPLAKISFARVIPC
jgi:hypothetical protein